MRRFIFITFLLLLLILNYILYNLFPEEKALLYYFIFFSFIFQILVPALKIIQKRADVFDPFFIFLFLFQFFYFIHPLQIILYGPTIFFIKNMLDTGIHITMFYLINMSVLSFYIGYFFVNDHLPIQYRSDIIVSEKQEKRTGKYLSLIFVFIGFLSFFFIIRGNFFFYIQNLELRALTIRGNGILILFSFFTPVGIFGYFYFNSIGKRKISFPLVLLTSFFLLLFLMEGARAKVFIVLLALLIYYHYRIRRIKLKKLVLLSTIVFLLFWVFAIFRSSISIKDEIVNYDRPLITKVITRMFYSTEHFVVTLLEPYEKKIQGRGYLEPLTIWIPSFIWPDKPLFGLEKIYINHYFPGLEERGVSFGPGVIGAGVMNYGYAAVFVDFFLLGLLLKFLYLKFKRLKKSPQIYELIYYFTIPAIIFISVSRAFITSFSVLPLYLIPVFLLFYGKKFIQSVLSSISKNRSDKEEKDHRNI